MSEHALAGWIGRREEQVDWVTSTRLAAWHATFDRVRPFPLDGDHAPPGFHWTLFPPLAAASDLGVDGHARRGDFLPPVSLPRRMWAGSRLVLHQPLGVGERVERESTIVAVDSKDGRRGPLVRVTVRHLISGTNGLAIEEDQDIVYLSPAASDAIGARPADAAPQGAWRRSVNPTAPLLFRYSALTFNSHRIHYDRPYAEQVEGYGGLVVHGPLIATLLLNLLASELPDADIERFTFRALRPTVDVSPFELHGENLDLGRRVRLWSTDGHGHLAVEAEATLR